MRCKNCRQPFERRARGCYNSKVPHGPSASAVLLRGIPPSESAQCTAKLAAIDGRTGSGQVAQVVERSPEKAGVGGSTPSLATIYFVNRINCLALTTNYRHTNRTHLGILLLATSSNLDRRSRARHGNFHFDTRPEVDVIVYRHKATCVYTKREQDGRCRCPKHIYVRLVRARISAKTRSWETAQVSGRRNGRTTTTL